MARRATAPITDLAASQTTPAVDGCPPPEQALPSRILPMVCEHIAGREHPAILDLGAALGPTVQFLTRYKPQLHFADLFSCAALQCSTREMDADEAKRFIEQRMDIPAGVTFDACFLWDALHCVSLPLLEGLVAALRPHIHDDTVVYAFGSLQSQWLDHARFSIRAEETLLIRPVPERGQFQAQPRQRLREHFAYLDIEREAILRDGRLEMLLGAH